MIYVQLLDNADMGTKQKSTSNKQRRNQQNQIHQRLGCGLNNVMKHYKKA